MKALQIVKKEIMELTTFGYILWMICMFSGCFAYLNPPNFINAYPLDVLSFLSKTLGVAWGFIVAFMMGMVAVIANKVGNKWWEDHGKLLYEKWFGTKKNKKKNHGKDTR